MKKVFVVIAIIVATYNTFAGYAWFSEEINAILAKMPSKYYTKLNVTLWGYFLNNIWSPPYGVYNTLTGEISVENYNSFSVTSYADLNEYGKYDVEKSLESMLDNCGQYITDEFGNGYTFYDDTVAAFYIQYEKMNMSTVEKSFDSLKSAFEMWRSDIVTSTTTLITDIGEYAELTKEIHTELGKAKEEIENTVKETKATSEKLSAQLSDVKESLTKISEEAVYNAQKKIEDTVVDFNSFVNGLESAINLGEWDDAAFESAFGELTKSEQDLVDAITALQNSSSDPEVSNAITVLGGQLSSVQSLKTSLRAAITNHDKDAARGVLTSAKNLGFYDSRKSIAAINNKIKSLKSKSEALNVLVDASLSTIDSQRNIETLLASLRSAFSAMFITMMDNFHQINSYLGSTNSMAYINKRLQKENSSLADFTVYELARWMKISMQDPLFRNNVDKANYETIGRLGVSGGGTFDNIFRLIGSTYFVTYMDTEWLDRFMSTYDEGGFEKKNIRGFYEEIEAVAEGGVTTNWYASKITAPKNWADGTSIFVTNGQYHASGSGIFVTEHNGATATPKANEVPIPVNVDASGRRIVFRSADDSDVRINVSTNKVTGDIILTFGVYWK